MKRGEWGSWCRGERRGEVVKRGEEGVGSGEVGRERGDQYYRARVRVRG